MMLSGTGSSPRRLDKVLAPSSILVFSLVWLVWREVNEGLLYMVRAQFDNLRKSSHTYRSVIRFYDAESIRISITSCSRRLSYYFQSNRVVVFKTSRPLFRALCVRRSPYRSTFVFSSARMATNSASHNTSKELQEDSKRLWNFELTQFLCSR
jgi:hypothetical protein